MKTAIFHNDHEVLKIYCQKFPEFHSDTENPEYKKIMADFFMYAVEEAKTEILQFFQNTYPHLRFLSNCTTADTISLYRNAILQTARMTNISLFKDSMEWLLKKTIFQDEKKKFRKKGPLECDEFFLELYNTICNCGSVFVVLEKFHFLETNFPSILYDQTMFNFEYDENKRRYLSAINLQVPLGIATLGVY